MTSKSIATEETDTHLLTTIEWISMPEYFTTGRLETGIRTKPDLDDFSLIQHGWMDWKDAHEFIKKCLAKGWDSRRINDAMEFLIERGRYRVKAEVI